MPSEGMEKVAVGRTASFFIEGDSNLGSPNVQVLSPTRKTLSVDVNNTSSNRHEVNFIPEDVGKYYLTSSTII